MTTFTPLNRSVPQFGAGRTSLIRRLGGALAGVALLGATAQAASPADSFRSNRPAEIQRVQAAPGSQLRPVGAIGKDMGNQMLEIMRGISGLARSGELPEATLQAMRAAVDSVAEAARVIDEIDMGKALSRDELVAVGTFVDIAVAEGENLYRAIQPHREFIARVMAEQENRTGTLYPMQQRLSTLQNEFVSAQMEQGAIPTWRGNPGQRPEGRPRLIPPGRQLPI